MMDVFQLSEMMWNSGYSYIITPEESGVSGGKANIVKTDNPDVVIGMIEVNPVGDFALSAEGKKDVTFVDGTDVIMWIVQNL